MKEKTEKSAGKKVHIAADEHVISETPERESSDTPKQEKHDGSKKAKREFPVPCVYCGPSIRGVARQFTVYTGEIPGALLAFVKEHPEARGLMVSVGQFPKTRQNLGRSGTAEAILYEKIKNKM